MAGKNQHYLPRFLQKGFASKTNGKDRYTWLYRKEHTPTEENIANIGAEAFFYGDPDNEVSADPAITEVENPFARLMDSLRNVVPKIRLQDARIPLLVGHLAIRTKYVRAAAIEAGANLITALTKQFPSQRQFEELILSPQYMEHFLSEVPNWDRFPETLREVARGMYKSHVAQNLGPYYRRCMEIMAEQSESAIAKMEPTLRLKFNQRLAQAPSPEAVALRYGKFAWTVQESGACLILGDCVSVVENADGLYKGIDDSDSPARRIFVPIASNRFLVGSLETNPAISAKALNEAAVASSYDFFISAERSSDLESLIPRIRESAELLSKDQAEELARVAICEGMAEIQAGR